MRWRRRTKNKQKSLSQILFEKTLISKANMKNLVTYLAILLAALMLLGCGDKTKEPLALHNKLTTALEKKDFGFIFDSLTIESQEWALDFISGVSEYSPDVAEIAKTKSGRDLFVAVCEKGRVISDVFKAEKITKIEVNGDEAIIMVEGDPFPSMMIRENGDWKFKPKFHVLYGMKDKSKISDDKQPSMLDSAGSPDATSESEGPITPDDQFELGRRYYNGIGLPKDEAEAVKWFRKAAEKGHAKAQYNLGICYFQGHGVEEDGPEAGEWFRKAAEQGLAASQHNLGYFYENGITLPKDESEAVKWYRRAADQGYANSQHSLGHFYLKGITLPKDEAEAVKWFRKAAEQGYADSQNSLGYIYEKGVGTTKDVAEAVKWYGKAAEQGKAEGMYNLGLIYSLGEGLPKDYVRAYKWLTICASGGNPQAISLRGTFENSMSQEEIAEAQRLVREWNPDLGISNAKNPRNSDEPEAKTANPSYQQDAPSNNTGILASTNEHAIIGKPSKCGLVEVDVKTIDYSQLISCPLGNSNASDGATYVIVNWTYKNISSQPMNALKKPVMYLVSNENARIKIDIGASATYASTLDNNEKIISDLNPGIKSDTSSVFEVAKELFDPFTWKILVEYQNSQTYFKIREKEKMPSLINNLVSIGQSADFDGISTKIDSVQTKSSYGNHLVGYAGPAEGSVFVEVNWVIENRSPESISSEEFEIFLVPEDGRKYVAHRLATVLAFIDDGGLYQNSQIIEPNIRLKRRDVFEVPKSKFKPLEWAAIVRRGDKDNWFSLIPNTPNQARAEGANTNAKSQSFGKSADSGQDKLIDEARAELELEKIKLERERIELERERIRMQSSSGQKTDESKIAADPISAAVASSATVPAMPGERYPETRLQLLGPADLMDMNLNDLRYAINEMYARRGAVFKNAEIAKSFTSKEWFKPRPGVTFQEIEAEFSNIEADNLRLLGKERDRKAASADLYELIDSESNIREGPGTTYPIIRKSRKGEVGKHQSAKMRWMKLQFSDGSMGWVHEQNVKSKN